MEAYHLHTTGGLNLTMDVPSETVFFRSEISFRQKGRPAGMSVFCRISWYISLRIRRNSPNIVSMAPRRVVINRTIGGNLLEHYQYALTLLI